MPVFWGDLGVTIMRLDPQGTLTLVAGGGRLTTPGVPALEYGLASVLGLAINPFTGDLLIASSDGKVFVIRGVAEPG